MCLDVVSYPCCWGGIHDGKPYVARLEKFAEMVLNNLWNAVKKFYPAEVSESVIAKYSDHALNGQNFFYCTSAFSLVQQQQYCVAVVVARGLLD